MPRRLVKKPSPEMKVTSETLGEPIEESSLPDEPEKPKEEPAKPLDLEAGTEEVAAGDKLDRVISAVFRFDPDKVADQLAKAERLPKLTLSIAMHALNDAQSLAIKASKMASAMGAEASRYKQFEMVAREAELRDRARDKMPLRENKDGSSKKPTIQELADYILANHAEEFAEIKTRQIELEEAAAHWQREAEVWKYRPNALGNLVESLRLMGDTRTSD